MNSNFRLEGPVGQFRGRTRPLDVFRLDVERVTSTPNPDSTPLIFGAPILNAGSPPLSQSGGEPYRTAARVGHLSLQSRGNHHSIQTNRHLLVFSGNSVAMGYHAPGRWCSRGSRKAHPEQNVVAIRGECYVLG